MTDLLQGVALVALIALAARFLARRLGLGDETQIQCWHCRRYAEVSDVRWSTTKFNGHQVPLCRACEPEAAPPSPRPTLVRVA